MFLSTYYDRVFSCDLDLRLVCQHCSIIFWLAYIILKKFPYFKLDLVPVPPALNR